MNLFQIFIFFNLLFLIIARPLIRSSRNRRNRRNSKNNKVDTFTQHILYAEHLHIYELNSWAQYSRNHCINYKYTPQIYDSFLTYAHYNNGIDICHIYHQKIKKKSNKYKISFFTVLFIFILLLCCIH